MKMTEQECREFNGPWPRTREDLHKFIDDLDDLNNDYGTAAYAMSLAAYAAFMYIAYKFGTTGFQAGCADLDFLRRSRRYKGPFMVLDFENHLYPQYDLVQKVKGAIEENKEWFTAEAKKRLAQYGDNANPNVIAHWKTLAKDTE